MSYVPSKYEKQGAILENRTEINNDRDTLSENLNPCQIALELPNDPGDKPRVMFRDAGDGYHRMARLDEINELEYRINNLGNDFTTALEALRNDFNTALEAEKQARIADLSGKVDKTGAGTDFNDMLVSGNYAMSGGANAPAGNSTMWNLFVSSARSSSEAIQVASYHSEGNTNIYIRRRSSGAWRDWQTIVTGNVLNAHTNNSDIHVTTTDKNNWNAKQNALDRTISLGGDVVGTVSDTGGYLNMATSFNHPVVYNYYGENSSQNGVAIKSSQTAEILGSTNLETFKAVFGNGTSVIRTERNAYTGLYSNMEISTKGLKLETRFRGDAYSTHPDGTTYPNGSSYRYSSDFNVTSSLYFEANNRLYDSAAANLLQQHHDLIFSVSPRGFNCYRQNTAANSPAYGFQLSYYNGFVLQLGDLTSGYELCVQENSSGDETIIYRFDGSVRIRLARNGAFLERQAGNNWVQANWNQTY